MDAVTTEDLRPEDMARVDLAAFRSGDAAGREACLRAARSDLEQRGFLAVVGHGVEAEALRRGHDVARAFFSLPERTKRRYSKGRGAVGYIPHGVEQALRAKRPDLKELWHHAHEPSADHPARRAFPDAYPVNRDVSEIAGMREALVELDALFASCADDVLRLFAAVLGLPEERFAALADGGPHMLRLVRYPPLPAKVPRGVERAVEHTGAGLFGLLPPATGPGLSVRSPGGRWQRLVGFGPEHVVVTIADQLERLSNGRLPGSLHRVENPVGEARERERFAIVYFAGALPDTILWPPPELLAGAPPPAFEKMTADEFVARRMDEVWLNQASLPYRLLSALRLRVLPGSRS